jgi:hypothetical protein
LRKEPDGSNLQLESHMKTKPKTEPGETPTHTSPKGTKTSWDGTNNFRDEIFYGGHAVISM